MKNLLQSRVFLAVAGVAVLAVIAVGAVVAFDLPTVWERRRAIHDIKLNRDVEAARKRLMELNDRQGVLEAIKDALEDAGDSVDAKLNLLTTLSSTYFNQPRVIERAIGSDVAETRRAAAFLLHGAEDRKDECRTIALEWLQDEKAGGRSKAVLLCRRLDVQEAVPVLLRALDRTPEDQAELEMTRHALAALGQFKPEGLSGKLMAMAENASLHELVRADALDTLATLDDAPRDKVQDMAIRLLQDKSNSVSLRTKMTGVLRKPAYADDKTWYALEQVVKDSGEEDYITQRSCLQSLAAHVPLDRLRQLLLDRAVYLHPYYAIRSDVAVALGAMNVRERVVLDIMAQYLTFESADPKIKDTQNLVRREAWMTLWQLGGVMVGVDESDLFRRPPPPHTDPQRIRENLWSSQWLRPGLSKAAWEATAKPAEDLNRMRESQQHYTDAKIIGQIEDLWERDRLAREELEKRNREATEEAVVPIGPTPGGEDTPKDGDGDPGADDDED